MSRYRRKRHSALRKAMVMTIIILCLALTVWGSNAVLQTEEFTFRSVRLPESFDGYRVAVLSDLHGAVFGEGNAVLLEQTAAAAPDMIAVTGDLEDQFRGHDPDWVAHLAEELAKIAPVYYITGNHEWAVGDVPALKKTLSGAGWTVLSNRFVPLERNGETIVLAGIDDPNGYADQKSPETVTTELHAEWGDPFWILLAHRNNRFEHQYSLLGADLTVSGHGHGGIIRLPFTDGLLSTERTLFPSYTDGFYEANGATVFVSRGIGNSGRLLRIFNPPQIAVITLRCGEGSQTDQKRNTV